MRALDLQLQTQAPVLILLTEDAPPSGPSATWCPRTRPVTQAPDVREVMFKITEIMGTAPCFYVQGGFLCPGRSCSIQQEEQHLLLELLLFCTSASLTLSILLLWV